MNVPGWGGPCVPSSEYTVRQCLSAGAYGRRLLAGAGLWGIGFGVAAATLPPAFEPLPEPVAAAAETAPFLLRSQAVRVRADALPSVDSKPGARSLLNFFPDQAATVEWQTLDRHGARNYGWHGKPVDDPLGAATLTVVGDCMVLDVISPDRGQFQTLTRSDGRSVVRQFDTEKLKGAGARETKAVAAAPAADVGDDPRPLAVTPVTIDVLMVYTAAARDKAGGRSDIVALAQAAVNGENGNFSRSDVAHRMRLVQTREVGHTASGNLSTELSWVAGNSTVADVRNTAGADLVAFLSDKDDYGILGIAMQLTSTSGNSGQAFSANYYDTVAGVWPHEAGHNLGCQHNSAGVYSYSSGHYWTDGDSGKQYGSIMSYIGARVPYFSNPDVNYSGEPTGTASRDNARSIDNIGDNVAGYKTSKTLIEPSCDITASTTKPREGVDFTITVKTVNGGPSTMTACKIAVTLPSKLTLVSHNGGTAFDTGTKVWDVPDAGDGVTRTLVLTVRPNAGSAGVSITASAKVDSIGSGFVDFNLYNNEDSVALVPGPPVTTDLVLHYKLDETAGKTAYDASTVEGGAQNAVTTNAAPQWQPGGGIIGGALRLSPDSATNVSQSFSYNASSGILAGYPFTLALWARAPSGSWYRVCAMLGDPAAMYTYYELDFNGANRACAMARNTTQIWATSPDGLTVTDDRWHHLAGVYPSAGLRILYVDGVPVATNTTSVSFVANVKRFSIGALMRSTPTQAFLGHLDDIGLWSTALAPERIAAIHALGRHSGVDLNDEAVGTMLAVYSNRTGFAQAGGLVWIPATGLPGAPGSSGLRDGLPYVVLTAAGEGFAALRQPTLSLQSADPGALRMSWHAGFADWILEESDDFAAWFPAPETVNDDGATCTAEHAVEETARRFFRLRQP